MLKYSILTEIQLDNEIVSFIEDVENIAKDYCRFFVADQDNLKYNPSIIAASYIYIGFLVKVCDLLIKSQLHKSLS